MFVRRLQGDDWQDYKRLRLEALTNHQDLFGAALADEQALSDSAWREMLDDRRSAIFGLVDGTEMVGITAAFTCRDDETGRTAILAASYIRGDYRGRGLSRLLYRARLDWAKAERRFDRVLVGHREGNETSRRANQAFGFAFTGTEQKRFGDGRMATIHTYEMRLT